MQFSFVIMSIIFVIARHYPLPSSLRDLPQGKSWQSIYCFVVYFVWICSVFLFARFCGLLLFYDLLNYGLLRRLAPRNDEREASLRNDEE